MCVGMSVVCLCVCVCVCVCVFEGGGSCMHGEAYRIAFSMPFCLSALLVSSVMERGSSGFCGLSSSLIDATPSVQGGLQIVVGQGSMRRKRKGREPFIVPSAWKRMVHCMSVVAVVMATVLTTTQTNCLLWWAPSKLLSNNLLRQANFVPFSSVLARLLTCLKCLT